MTRNQNQGVAAVVMWGCLLAFGLPGLALAWFNELPNDQHRYLALTFVIIESLIATVLTTFIYWKHRRRKTA